MSIFAHWMHPRARTNNEEANDRFAQTSSLIWLIVKYWSILTRTLSPLRLYCPCYSVYSPKNRPGRVKRLSPALNVPRTTPCHTQARPLPTQVRASACSKMRVDFAYIYTRWSTWLYRTVILALKAQPDGCALIIGAVTCLRPPACVPCPPAMA